MHISRPLPASGGRRSVLPAEIPRVSPCVVVDMIADSETDCICVRVCVLANGWHGVFFSMGCMDLALAKR